MKDAIGRMSFRTECRNALLCWERGSGSESVPLACVMQQCAGSGLQLFRGSGLAGIRHSAAEGSAVRPKTCAQRQSAPPGPWKNSCSQPLPRVQNLERGGETPGGAYSAALHCMHVDDDSLHRSEQA